jgi:hypothetical protein
VKDSEFQDGNCENFGAGNVDVSTTGPVSFVTSSFMSGSTEQRCAGGGAFVYRSQSIVVDSCLFEGNKGFGVGLYGDKQDVSYAAVIRDSVFNDNEGS